MKSAIRTAIENIIGGKGICYIDPRKKGYRMKFMFATATERQQMKIGRLSSNITKVENIICNIPGRGSYQALCIHFDCRPVEVGIKRICTKPNN